MEYKEIVAVTGEPGLFQLLSSKSDGAIVRTLDGQTTKFVPSRNHQFTPLESIEVFTTGENVSLVEVFRAMSAQESSIPPVDAGKDGKEIKTYFHAVYPGLDDTRVYMSDLKKMLKWYPLLKAHDLLKAEEPATTAVTEEPSVQTEEAPEEPEQTKEKEKTAPKAKAKPKTKTEAAPGEEKETPKKKAAAKKPKAAKKENDSHPT